MHTIHESKYTVIKQPCSGNSKAKQINKSSLVYRSYQAHLMGWMYLMIFTQLDHPFAS